MIYYGEKVDACERKVAVVPCEYGEAPPKWAGEL